MPQMSLNSYRKLISKIGISNSLWHLKLSKSVAENYHVSCRNAILDFHIMKSLPRLSYDRYDEKTMMYHIL